ncbi:hypothetical protein NQ314_013076 [Rhamnusium bicolor]|uniref:Uncharacterized protein n=1 Tax=Rhamnusium bicolor TaxID=1586634 RepID=A0AAV8X901_9CUCU|nr:hypothetical protein NQ314_013076 [Rhamnusium bicolor]
MKRIFNRPYMYELDCTEVARLDKLRDKCERENADFENSFEKLLHAQKEREKPTIVVKSCKEGPPGWWKADMKQIETKKGLQILSKANVRNAVTVTRKDSCPRWQEEPNLAGLVQDDPCRRKYDMNM